MGIITINWSDCESSAHYVQAPKAFKSVPLYGECWKFKNFICYASISGYYRFYKDGSVTLDNGIKVKKCSDISFIYNEN